MQANGQLRLVTQQLSREIVFSWLHYLLNLPGVQFYNDHLLLPISKMQQVQWHRYDRVLNLSTPRSNQGNFQLLLEIQRWLQFYFCGGYRVPPFAKHISDTMKTFRMQIVVTVSTLLPS